MESRKTSPRLQHHPLEKTAVLNHHRAKHKTQNPFAETVHARQDSFCDRPNDAPFRAAAPRQAPGSALRGKQQMTKSSQQQPTSSNNTGARPFSQQDARQRQPKRDLPTQNRPRAQPVRDTALEPLRPQLQPQAPARDKTPPTAQRRPSQTPLRRQASDAEPVLSEEPQRRRNSDQDTRRRPSQRQRRSSQADEPVQKEQAQGAREGPLEGSRRVSAARQTQDPPVRAVPSSRRSTARTADEDPDGVRRPSQAAKDASWLRRSRREMQTADRQRQPADRRPSEEQASARRPSQVSRPADARTQERGRDRAGRERKGGREGETAPRRPSGIAAGDAARRRSARNPAAGDAASRPLAPGSTARDAARRPSAREPGPSDARRTSDTATGDTARRPSGRESGAGDTARKPSAVDPAATDRGEPARRGNPTTDTTPADFQPSYSKPPRSQAARGAAAASGSREPASDAPNLRAGPQRQSPVRRAAADDRRAVPLSEDPAASARRNGGRDAATLGQALAAAGEGR